MEQIWQRFLDAFSGFSLFDVIDILLFFLLVYGLFLLLKRNNMLKIVKFIAGIIVAAFLCILFIDEMRLMGTFAVSLFSSFVLIFVIVFRYEIKRGIMKMASPRDTKRFNAGDSVTDEDLERSIKEIVRGTTALAKTNTGALIVLSATDLPGNVIESGTRLDSHVSAPLLECLFNTNAPLHDGAVVIKGNNLVAAGCFLPLSQNTSIPKELGTRHRAALGVSELTDSLTVICSEETGVISVCKNGMMTRYLDAKMLTQTLEQFFGLKVEAPVKKRGRGERGSRT